MFGTPPPLLSFSSLLFRAPGPDLRPRPLPVLPPRQLVDPVLLQLHLLVRQVGLQPLDVVPHCLDFLLTLVHPDVEGVVSMAPGHCYVLVHHHHHHHRYDNHHFYII